MEKRRATRQVKVAGIPIGGNSPVSVQSMTNSDTGNLQATLKQIKTLAAAGCQLVRVAVPDKSVVPVLPRLCAESPVPLIADIHYDFMLALHALDAGFSKLRLNPGNMSQHKAVKQVTAAAVKQNVPIRVGVNSGSIHPRYRHLPRIEAMVESAIHYCTMLEEYGCRDIVVSLKSSSVRETWQANKMFAARTDYPLHLGVTEAGTLSGSTIKSSIGIGALLLDGIGDTIRVSVTGHPLQELPVALGILRALGLGRGLDIISCPTCGRTNGDLVAVVKMLEERFGTADIPLQVAVMGCSVNGPGEARHADMGIAFGPQRGVFFRGGEVVATMDNEQLPAVLIDAIEQALLLPKGE